MPADEQPVRSVWTRPPRAKEQPALSRERIVSAALELLDAEGIDALSMRRLGARLNAGATSLYWHVATKNALIELVVDEVYGELEIPEVEDPTRWREATIGCAQTLRAVILRHPWIVSVLGEAGLAQLGPNMMRAFDRMLTIGEAAGFSLDEAEQAMNTMVAYVIGIATTEAAWLKMVSRSGDNEGAVVEHLWPSVEEAAHAYPRLEQLYAAQRGKDPETAREDIFSYGLERVIDGLEVRLRAGRTLSDYVRAD